MRKGSKSKRRGRKRGERRRQRDPEKRQEADFEEYFWRKLPETTCLELLLALGYVACEPSVLFNPCFNAIMSTPQYIVYALLALLAVAVAAFAVWAVVMAAMLSLAAVLAVVAAVLTALINLTSTSWVELLAAFDLDIVGANHTTVWLKSIARVALNLVAAYFGSLAVAFALVVIPRHPRVLREFRMVWRAWALTMRMTPNQLHSWVS